jgi:hypothetical protein
MSHSYFKDPVISALGSLAPEGGCVVYEDWFVPRDVLSHVVDPTGRYPGSQLSRL